MDDDNTLYQRLGGRSMVHAIANRFYDVMQAQAHSQTILNMHPNDLTRSRKQLERYLCEWLGGPKSFGENYMSPEWIKRRHQHLHIGFDERYQWMACMSQAMHELNLDKELQHQLNSQFFQIAGFIRNQPSSND